MSVTNAAGVAQASSSFIGNINPIRYRGYYYDTDLGLYYLQPCDFRIKTVPHSPGRLDASKPPGFYIGDRRFQKAFCTES